MKLVICEKPSISLNIGKALGKFEKQYGEIKFLGQDQNKPIGFQQGSQPIPPPSPNSE